MSLATAAAGTAKGPAKVLVGGGTGFIGRALVKALEAKGHGCRIVTRTPDIDKHETGDELSWRDIQESGLPVRTSAVINLAGQKMFDPSQRWHQLKSTIWSSRVGTTKTLRMAIENTPESLKPQVFIGMSGVGYYAPSPTAEYTEESFGGFADYLGQLAKAWETETRLQMSSKVRKVIIRSGVVLGRDGGAVKQMWWPFYCGLGGPVGSGKQYFPWIHIDDLVQLIIYSIENEHVSGILNGVAPQIITNKEFAKALGKAMKRPAVMPLPEFVLKTVFNEECAKIMTEGQKVIPKRTLETGFKFKYHNIDDACRSIVAKPEA